MKNQSEDIEDDGNGREKGPLQEDNVARYVRQVNSLTLIRHLNLLMIACQKHRGASLALLGGENAFERKLISLQSHIDWRVETISLFNRQFCEIVEAQQWESIRGDWQSIRTNWRNDSIQACFEFHNHFVESLIKLMWEITSNGYYFSLTPNLSQLDPLIVDGHIDQGSSGVNSFGREHHTLIQISMRLLPELIETIAKLRGLATHAAAKGECDNESQMRIAYLIQGLCAQKEKLATLSKSLGGELLTGLPALVEILLHEHKLDQIKQISRQEIMKNGPITVNSEELFDFATSTIDAYYKAIEAGVDLFQHKLDNAVG